MHGSYGTHGVRPIITICYAKLRYAMVLAARCRYPSAPEITRAALSVPLQLPSATSDDSGDSRAARAAAKVLPATLRKLCRAGFAFERLGLVRLLFCCCTCI